MNATSIVKMMKLKENVKKARKKTYCAYALSKMTRTISLAKSRQPIEAAEPLKESSLKTHFMNAVIQKRRAV